MAQASWARSDKSRAKLKDTECTDEHLTDFFNSIWISRIWTYQEAILSQNPVVVQGYDQIPWVQLEHSVIFLASIHLTVNLRQWIDVVFTREMFRANVEDLASYESRLLDYWKFCHVIAAKYHWGTAFKWALAAVAYLATMLPIWILHEHWKLKPWEDILLVSLPSAILLFLYPWLIFEAIPRLAPNPSYPYAVAQDFHHETERYLQSNIYERLLETLTTRSATEHRDMSFGLQSIIDRLPQNINTPTVDYTFTKAKVYEQLTIYLMQKLGVVQILELAAQKRCNGAPSWVPDYSQDFENLCKLMIFPIHCSATSNSKPHFELHPKCCPAMIKVKGFLVEKVTTVRLESQESCDPLTKITTYRPFTCIQTTSFKGYACNDVKVGDQIALISGFSFPFVVREDCGRNSVKMIAPATLALYKDKNKNSFHGTFLNGKVWRAYETQRKKEWMEEQQRVSMHPEGAPVLDPAVYLEDMLIS